MKFPFLLLVFCFSIFTLSAQTEEPKEENIPLEIVDESAVEPTDELPPDVTDEPDVNAFILGAEEPQPLNMDDVRRLIGYPAVARDANIQGQVVARVLVDKEGNYRKHVIVKTGHPILRDSVEQHLPKLKFTPAMKNGEAILFWVNIPFRFMLLGDAPKKKKKKRKR